MTDEASIVGGRRRLPLLRGRGGASWHRWRYPFTRRTPLLTETDYNPFTLAAERKILNPAPILWVIGLAAVAVFPPIFGNNSFVLASTSFAMYAAINVIWMLTTGTAGIFSLAALATVGVGAYGSSYLSVYYHFPWWAMWLTGPVFGLVFGVFIAIPAIRLEGFYYALLTVGITELCRVYVIQDQTLGSTNGLLGADTFVPSWMSDRGGLTLGFYLGFLLLIGALTLYRVVNGQRIGRLLRAAPERQEAFAEALGINYRNLRIQVFLISSAALGGVGSFYATLLHSATPTLFSLDQLLLLLAMAVVGGIGTAEGAVVGTLIVTLFDKVFIGLGPVRLVLIAAIMIGTVLFLRGGLFGIRAQYVAWRGKRQSQRRGRRSDKGGEVMPEEAIEIADKQAIFLRRFDASVRADLKRLVTDELIEEHRTTFGKRRSDALERVLTYFRAAGVADKYAVLAVKPFAEYRIVALSGRRGVPPRAVDDQVFTTPDDALHGVFLKRVQDLMEFLRAAEERNTMAYIRISAYTDKLSVKPGDPLRVMASVDATDRVRAQLVRLIHGDEHPDGPGFVEQPVASPIDREWPARKQYVQKGNFLRVADPQGKLAPTGPLTLHAYIYPTLPAAGRQVVLGRWSVDGTSGFALGINAAGRLEFWVGDGAGADAVAAEVKLVPSIWYFVAASYDPASGVATLYQEAVVNRYNSLLSKIVPYEYRSHVRETLRVRPSMPADTGFVIGAATERNQARGTFFSQCYNGKIDRCGVQGSALDRAALDAIRQGGRPDRAGVLADWDTAAGYSEHGIGDRVADIGPHQLHAEGHNRPVRGMTGWNWSGRNDCFRLAPQEFGGIELHADALIDCNWEPTLTLTVPNDLRSGVYAIKLTAGDAEEYTPFFVRPSAPKAAICLLIPTASYLAYANIATAFDGALLQGITASTPIFQEVDIEVYKNDVEFGLSTYDLHNDGAGVCYSSYRRPIINFRPKYRVPGIGATWQFPADLSIVGWLEAMKYDYDVLTDEDLHREGVAALKPYRVVLNTTHNEYYSERMMDATEDYLADGGRLLNLGANTHYWCVGFRDEEPWVMEVRKLEAGSRAWQARPGEHYLASTGERSGLWRHRGRPPQKLIGVGFTSEGMDQSVPYRRMPDSYHRSVAWMFDGIEGEVFGDAGLGLGGAAGIEIDRYELALGTPPHARILASSERFTDNYPLVQEEIYFMTPGLGGTQHPHVRADIVYFTTPNHGAVFATGSIAWGSALPSRNYDNAISRLTKNVVDAFLKAGPLPGSSYDG